MATPIPQILATTREGVVRPFCDAVTVHADPLAVLFGMGSMIPNVVNTELKDAVQTVKSMSAALKSKAVTAPSQAGGWQYVVNVMLSYPGTAKKRGRFEKGPTTDVSKVRRAIYQIAELSQSVLLDPQDVRINQDNETRIIAYVKERMTEQFTDLFNSFGDWLWNGDTSNGQWAGITKLITTSAGTVGGLSQTTYTEWNPERETGFGSFSTNDGIGKMSELIAKTGQRAGFFLIIAHKDVLGYFAKAVSSKQSLTLGLQNSPAKASRLWTTLGYGHTLFSGAPVLASPHAPSGTMYGIDLTHLTFKHTPPALFSQQPGAKPVMVGPVELGPWVNQANPPTWVMMMAIFGAVIADKLNCHWVITGITA